MAQSLYKAVAVTTTSSTSPINILDVIITTIDGLAYANTGVMVRWKILGSYGTSNVGYFEVVSTWLLVSGSLSNGAQSIIAQMGALSGLSNTYAVAGGNAARITITPPTSSSMKWFAEAEVMVYDSGI